jgi:hypothetical protein
VPSIYQILAKEIIEAILLSYRKPPKMANPMRGGKETVLRHPVLTKPSKAQHMHSLKIAGKPASGEDAME